MLLIEGGFDLHTVLLLVYFEETKLPKEAVQ